MLPLFIAAFSAGVLMFLAPCTLPILPGYLAFIAGVPLQSLSDPSVKAAARRKIFRNALAFVIGFSVVFVLLGTLAGFAGALIGPWRQLLGQAAGLVLIIFGLTMLGILRLPVLSRERRIGIPSFLVLGRMRSSALVGALFAIGWSPCIGPILGTILLVASNTATALLGAALLSVFSLGMALPFLLTALVVGKASDYVFRMQGFLQAISIFGGIVLIALGVLMLTGNMGLLITWGYELFDFIGYERLLNYL